MYASGDVIAGVSVSGFAAWKCYSHKTPRIFKIIIIIIIIIIFIIIIS